MAYEKSRYQKKLLLQDQQRCYNYFNLELNIDLMNQKSERKSLNLLTPKKRKQLINLIYNIYKDTIVSKKTISKAVTIFDQYVMKKSIRFSSNSSIIFIMMACLFIAMKNNKIPMSEQEFTHILNSQLVQSKNEQMDETCL